MTRLPEYLDFGRRVRSRRWKHQIPLVAFETRSRMLTREQKRKQQETPHGDRPNVAERIRRKSFGRSNDRPPTKWRVLVNRPN